MTPDNITQILVAVIALLSSIFGGILGYVGRSKKQAVIDAKREQEQADMFARLFLEMDGIKNRLDIHNKYAEKFGDIENSLTAIKKDIEYLRKELLMGCGGSKKKKKSKK